MASHWSWTVRLEIKALQTQSVHLSVLQAYWLHHVPKQPPNISYSFPQAFKAEAHSISLLASPKVYLGTICTRSIITSVMFCQVNFLKAINMMMDLCAPFKKKEASFKWKYTFKILLMKKCWKTTQKCFCCRYNTVDLIFNFPSTSGKIKPHKWSFNKLSRSFLTFRNKLASCLKALIILGHTINRQWRHCPFRHWLESRVQGWRYFPQKGNYTVIVPKIYFKLSPWFKRL